MRDKSLKSTPRRFPARTIVLAVAAMIGILVALFAAQTLAQTPSRWGWRNLYFGPFESQCKTWRYELVAQPDGQIQFHLIERGAYQFKSQGPSDNRYYDFLLGEPPCQFRMRIERNR